MSYRAIYQLPPETPLRVCEREALLEVAPLAEERAMHGDDRAAVAEC